MIRLERIDASAPAPELFAIDESAPHMRIGAHPVWRQALAGELPTERLKHLVTRLYPVVGGPGRYAFAAKVSQIDRADGVAQFEDLYKAAHEPRANADVGWRRIGEALKISPRVLDSELASPSPEAADFINVLHLHVVRGTPAEAAAVVWAIERQLPRLWIAFAQSLTTHYGLSKAAVDWLAYEGGRAQRVEATVKRLVEKYVFAADAYTVFEARRAAREAAWAWTALSETA